ncbi:MAG: nucleotidyltransferase family protein [Lachnospiraceae bacterium]|nr:nucleotidyltransferase family protein [Lachnospiraceae bacterium]
MKKTQYDMIYLAACGVDGVSPEKEFLNGLDMEKLYRLSYSHFMDALVGTTLKQAGVALPKGWNEHISKAVRKVVLFDTERAKLFSFMEQKGIWYLPLKGIVLKDYYPAVGMRQMSDNDILFDYSYCDEVQDYMESQGYEAVSVGIGNHDVYKKEPVYNFELHSTLYSELHQNGWAEYYGNVKDRLALNSGSSYGYHFADEDFYVYITSHAYKHYAGSGTGLRTLLDFYVYLKAKPEMDFAYIEKECEVLGIHKFEQQNRSLCKKVFDAAVLNGIEDLEQRLSTEEKDMLIYYLSSGVYGTVERGVENRVKKFQKKSGSRSKVWYLLNRLFPGMDTYKHYPFFYKHKWLLPVCWLYRVFRVLLNKGRRNQMVREIKVVKRIK